MADEFLRRPTVQTNAGMPDWVMLTASINSFPSCQVSYHKIKSDKAINASVSDTASEAAADQNAMFSPRFFPDMRVTLEDGAGGKLEFVGFKTAPSHRIGVGGVGSSVTVMHDSALMSAYAPYIYDAEPEQREDLNPESGSVAERAEELLDAITKAWQGNGRVRGAEEFEEIKDAIHSNNQRVVNMVKALWKASADSTSFEGMDGLGEFGGLNLGVNASILDVLTSQRSDFFECITGLCSMWQMFYKPGKKVGEMGQLVRLEDAVSGEDAEEKTVVTEDFIINAGPMSTLPVTGVITAGIPSKEHREGGSEEDETAAGVVPGSVVMHGSMEGRVATAPMPPFMSVPIHTPLLSDGVDLSSDAYAEAQQAQQDAIDAISSGPVKTMVEQWTRNIYTDLVLAASNAALTCPLDLSWEAGKTYKVRIKSKDSGSVLFQGLLNREQHVISTRGQNGVAETNLSFSHVLILNNTLPGG